MSDERKPVICPWCGEEMELFLSDYLYSGKACANYVCYGCSVDAPTAYGDTTKEAIEAAYAAATQRPPNRSLTREQVEAMPEKAIVYFVNVDRMDEAKGHFIGALPKNDAIRYLTRLDKWDEEILFAAPATPADIEAARKERA